MASVLTRCLSRGRSAYSSNNTITQGCCRRLGFLLHGCKQNKAPLCHESSQPHSHEIAPVCTPEFICLDGEWDEETKIKIQRDMLVFDDFLTDAEEESIMSEIGNYLKRMRYEYDHWDDAIHGFRETERLQWSAANDRVLARVRRLAFAADTLPHVHVLDLAESGVIKPHVDSVRFCGTTIAGLSLLSDAVMRLQSTEPPHRSLDALLRRRSLYVMRDSARYDYTHQVLAGAESQFSGRAVPRGRRVSVICRSAPDPPPGRECAGEASGESSAGR